MDRGDWQATVHEVAERHDLATKPPTNTCLLYYLAIKLLGVYPEELKHIPVQ